MSHSRVPASPAPSPSVAKKRIITSPRTAHDLSLRLGADGLHGTRASMVSPLTELLACSPAQLQPLSPEIGLSPRNWNSSRNSNIANASTQVAGLRDRSRGPVPLDLTSSGSPPRPARQQSGQHRSSQPDAPLPRDLAAFAKERTSDSGLLSQSDANASSTVPYSHGERGSRPPSTRVPPAPLVVSATSAPQPLHRSSALGSPQKHLNESRTVPESRWIATGGLGSSGLSQSGRTNSAATAPTPRNGVASALQQRPPRDSGNRTVDTYGLPSALLLGISSSGTTPHSPSTLMASPTGRSAFADSVLTTSSQLTGAGNTVCPVGQSATLNGIFAFAPDNRMNELSCRHARAPRLTSHLFLEDPAVAQDGATPQKSLQSPSLRDSKRHSGRTSQLSIAALDLSRTPLCSVDGRVSFSEDSNALTAVSVSIDMSRPSATNFMRGELIGKGSYGAVYRGMQRNNNRIIAMKEIRLPGVVEAQLKAPSDKPGAASAKEETALVREVEAVKRELTVLKQLSHPNIVRYLNDEIADGTLRIYMEYVSGGSVTSALKSYGSFEEPQAAALCFQLLQGLAYMHRRGIIHRDLKGDNLLLDTSSQLKIADLGTAKSIIASATMTAKIVGTAYFMPPEVLQLDGAVVGIAADIWSVACCVIEMLTGKPPLSDLPNQFTVMMAIAGSTTVPLRRYIPANNTWSSEVLDFISQCLRANPAERPTALELLQHRWFSKFLTIARAPSTPATMTSFLTPMAPSMERPQNSAPSRRLLSPTRSPEEGSVLRPQPSPGHSESRASSRTSRTSRDRKKKSGSEKRSSTRRHTRDSVSGITSATSHPSQESLELGSPQEGSASRRRNNSSQGASLTRAHSPPTKHRISHARHKNHPTQTGSGVLGNGLTSEGSRHSSITEGGVNQRTLTSSSTTGGASGGGGLTRAGFGVVETGLESRSRTNFLPAINLGGSSVQSPSSFSLDPMRTSRSLKNSGSSREPSKAYLYPPTAESTSRDSVPLGQYLSDKQTSLSRDAVESSMQMGSVTRVSVEGPLNGRGAGGHNMMGDVDGSGAYGGAALSSSNNNSSTSTGRRAGTRKNPRADL